MRIGRVHHLDLVLAVIGAGALIVEGLLRSNGGLSPGAYALAVAAAAPLAWRTRAPLAALGGDELGAVLCAAAFHASWAATALVLVVLYTVAVLGDRQRSLVVAAITVIGVVLELVVKFPSPANVPLTVNDPALGSVI